METQKSGGRLTQLGPVMQIAYVPADFDAALRFWTETMGVGPFFVREHVKLEKVLYRGAETDPDFDMALAYWGDVQVELIRQHNDAPSIYADWRTAGLQGVQHMCVTVEDMAATRALVVERGGTIVQEVFMPGGVGEAIYADMGGGPGTMIEYIWLDPARLAGFAAMRQAARDWDGRDPVRR
jgi:methylmalonyl-CoA/ethylmalonyl-CoA epimerase